METSQSQNTVDIGHCRQNIIWSEGQPPAPLSVVGYDPRSVQKPQFTVEHLSPDVSLYLGDCLAVLPTLSGVDAVVTDPPYGIGAADWDDEVPMWALLPISDALADGGSLYWMGVAPNVWKVANTEFFKFNRELVWWHKTGYPCARNYRLSTETILFLSKGPPAFFDADSVREEYAARAERPNGRPERQNPMGKSPGNVIELNRPAPRHADENFHPHAKPVALMEHFIKASCPESGTVCDPFMGSGTTGVAAVKLGRKFIGVEIDEKYYAIAKGRIQQAIEEREMDMFKHEALA